MCSFFPFPPPQAITEAYEVLCSARETDAERRQRDAATFTSTVECRLQKGPPGVGLGVRIGSKFNRHDNETQVVVLETLGLAAAAGVLQPADVLRKLDKQPLGTLAFEDVVEIVKVRRLLATGMPCAAVFLSFCLSFFSLLETD